MAKLSAEMRFSLATQLHPASSVTRLNQVFGGGTIEDRFVTLVMTVLNPRTHEITIVNAGHMPPMVRRDRTSSRRYPRNILRHVPDPQPSFTRYISLVRRQRTDECS